MLPVLLAACTGRLDLAWQPDLPVEQGDGTGKDGPYTAGPNDSVNDCRMLASGAGDTLSLSGAFAGGELLLVMQVQDELPAGQNALSDLSNAGRFELVRVVDTSDGTVHVAPALSHSYRTGAGRAAQVCTVPEFTDVTIPFGASIAATPWDGE